MLKIFQINSFLFLFQFVKGIYNNTLTSLFCRIYVLWLIGSVWTAKRMINTLYTLSVSRKEQQLQPAPGRGGNERGDGITDICNGHGLRIVGFIKFVWLHALWGQAPGTSWDDVTDWTALQHCTTKTADGMWSNCQPVLLINWGL